MLDLTAQDKELFLHREPWSTAQPQRTLLWRKPRQKWPRMEMENTLRMVKETGPKENPEPEEVHSMEH
jgi:hypothetical protein